jgi:hypothetical protein
LNSVGDHRFDDGDVVDDLAVCGSSSEISAPDWPYFANLNFGPSSFELGLMKAER